VGLELPLHRWVNDGLIVIFFFVVALEIRRELTVGELANRQPAALPVSLRVFVAAAAIADDVGSIVVIAFFYTAKVEGGESRRGTAAVGDCPHPQPRARV